MSRYKIEQLTDNEKRSYEIQQYRNELKRISNNKSLNISVLWPMTEDIEFNGFPFYNLEPEINYGSVNGIGTKGQISLTEEEADAVKRMYQIKEEFEQYSSQEYGDRCE